MTAEATAVLVPMLNPNEPDAVLVERVAEGQAVSAGDVLCVLETSKSTEELVAEAPGYVVGWRAESSQLVSAGDVLCFLASSPDWVPPRSPDAGPQPDSVPEGLRISQPALELARRHGLDLGNLPVGPMVTASAVRALIGVGSDVSPTVSASSGGQNEPVDATAVVVYGGSGHGKTLIELVRASRSYRPVAVVDQRLENGRLVLGVPVVGDDDQLAVVRRQGVLLAVNGVGGIARVDDRVGAFERLAAAGFGCPTVVHPSAVVEPSATLPSGAQVFAHAYVGSEVQLGFGTIVNTGAVVSHDCVVGDYVNLSPGALLAGGVRVGHRSLVGMGVTVNIDVTIGERARIGNSAVVKADVPDGQIVPAGTVWPPR